MVKIKKQISFDDRGIFGYIDLAPNGPISGNNLETKTYEIIDVFDRKYTVYLKTLIRLSSIIPETIAYHSEGMDPEATKKRLIERGIDITKPLAYYIFKKK